MSLLRPGDESLRPKTTRKTRLVIIFRIICLLATNTSGMKYFCKYTNIFNFTECIFKLFKLSYLLALEISLHVNILEIIVTLQGLGNWWVQFRFTGKRFLTDRVGSSPDTVWKCLCTALRIISIYINSLSSSNFKDSSFNLINLFNIWF